MIKSRTAKLTLLAAQREKLLDLISVYESAVKEGEKGTETCQANKVENNKFNEINTEASKIKLKLKAETVSLETVHVCGNLAYTCDQAGCSYSSSSYNNLVQHRVTHSNKRYLCRHHGCNFASKWKQVVRRHLWTHFAVKPHRCHSTGCGYQTSRKDYLRQHRKINHQK